MSETAVKKWTLDNVEAKCLVCGKTGTAADWLFGKYHWDGSERGPFHNHCMPATTEELLKYPAKKFVYELEPHRQDESPQGGERDEQRLAALSSGEPPEQVDDAEIRALRVEASPSSVLSVEEFRERLPACYNASLDRVEVSRGIANRELIPHDAALREQVEKAIRERDEHERIFTEKLHTHFGDMKKLRAEKDARIAELEKCDFCIRKRTLHPSGNFWECIPCHQDRTKMHEELTHLRQRDKLSVVEFEPHIRSDEGHKWQQTIMQGLDTLTWGRMAPDEVKRQVWLAIEKARADERERCADMIGGAAIVSDSNQPPIVSKCLRELERKLRDALPPLPAAEPIEPHFNGKPTAEVLCYVCGKPGTDSTAYPVNAGPVRVHLSCWMNKPAEPKKTIEMKRRSSSERKAYFEGFEAGRNNAGKPLTAAERLIYSSTIDIVAEPEKPLPKINNCVFNIAPHRPEILVHMPPGSKFEMFGCEANGYIKFIDESLKPYSQLVREKHESMVKEVAEMAHGESAKMWEEFQPLIECYETATKYKAVGISVNVELLGKLLRRLGLLREGV